LERIQQIADLQPVRLDSLEQHQVRDVSMEMNSDETVMIIKVQENSTIPTDSEEAIQRAELER
jgi:hypothetical protein